jgi:succinate dehydrogenase/fumarate reductase flavoprotein subunit
LQLLEEDVADLQCKDAKELKDALQAKSMLLSSRAVMQAALLRTESRGNYYRSDFPTRDDANWLRPIFASYNEETKQLKVEPGEMLEEE